MCRNVRYYWNDLRLPWLFIPKVYEKHTVRGFCGSFFNLAAQTFQISTRAYLILMSSRYLIRTTLYPSRPDQVNYSPVFWGLWPNSRVACFQASSQLGFTVHGLSGFVVIARFTTGSTSIHPSDIILRNSQTFNIYSRPNLSPFQTLRLPIFR
jgi:hypothetical protein